MLKSVEIKMQISLNCWVNQNWI